MLFYFSAEYSGNIDLKIRFILNNILRKIENELIDKSYGTEIVGVTAIPMIFDERFSNHKERKYISWINKESDVRLRVDFASFLYGDFEECCNLIYRNCIESFEYVYIKSKKGNKGDFHQYYNEFINDFKKVFDMLKSKISLEDIEKFNQLTDK